MDSEFTRFCYALVNEYGEIIGTHPDYEQAEMDFWFAADEGVKGLSIVELFTKAKQIT